MSTLNNGENGGEDGQTFVEELYDKFLECRLCSSTYRQPKMLVCQHTFCTDCLETHYEMDEQDRPYRFLLSHTRDLSCPCCRVRTPLPTGGVWRLPDNFLVANLTDVIRRRGPAVASKTGRGVCEICRPPSIVNEHSGTLEEVRAPSVKCVDCDKLLCSSCAELHRETKVTSSHALFTLSDSCDVECKIHRNETLRFYCEPCEQCVCVLCALHEHNEHDVSSLADGLERHRGTFDALLDDCRTRIDVVRQQLTLADAFRTSVNSAEERIRDEAIDAIAAVRRRERELLDGLRKFVGHDAMRFLDERDTLDVRLAELDGVRELTETMADRTNVEFLMAKKDIHERLRKAVERQTIQIPHRVRLGGVCYIAAAEPFHNLHLPTFDITQLFRSVADKEDISEQTVGNHITSSSSSESETDSEDSDNEDEQHQRKLVQVVSHVPETEHVDLVAVSEEDSGSEEDKDSDDDDGDVSPASPATKICISDGVVRRIVVESQTRSDAAEAPAPRPRGSGKIPDFSRPKAVVTFEDRGTEMPQVELTDASTTTTRVVLCEKETYTGYIYLVHKNVATDNMGTADKGTSTATDVTAAYRNVSTSGRSTACTRGTNTQKTMTSDRASSPVDAFRLSAIPSCLPAAVTKASGHPMAQRFAGAPLSPSTPHKSPSDTAPQVSSVSVKSPADAHNAQGNIRLQQATGLAASSASLIPASPAIPQQQTTAAIAPASFTGLASTRNSNVVLPGLRMTSPAASNAVVAQVSPTTPSSISSLQQQANATVSPTSQSANNQAPYSQKPTISRGPLSVTSSSPLPAKTSSQGMTSPSNVMTSPFVAVSPTPQQKMLPALSGNVSPPSLAVGRQVKSPSVSSTDTSSTSIATSTAVQQLVTSSDAARPKDPLSPTRQSLATSAALVPSTTDIHRSANNNNNNNAVTMISSKSTVVPSPTMLANSATAVRIAASVSLTASAPALAAVTAASLVPPNKSLTSVSSSLQRRDTAANAQSPATSSASQTTGTPQTDTAVMQKSAANVVSPQRTALSSNKPQNTTPQTAQSLPASNASVPQVINPTTSISTTSQQQQQAHVAVLPTSPTANSQPPYSTKPTSRGYLSVTSSPLVATTPSQSMTSPSDTMTSSVVVVSPTTQHPVHAPPASSNVSMTTASTNTLTSQSRLNSTSPINMASSAPPLQPTQSNTASSNSVATSVSTTTQKPMTSLVSSIPQSHRAPVPTSGIATGQPSISSQATAATTSRLPQDATVIPPVTITKSVIATTSLPMQLSASTTVQNSLTSTNVHQSQAASSETPLSLAGAAENTVSTGQAVTATTGNPGPNSPGMRVTSPPTSSSRPSVFRSMSMDSLRAPAQPVWRPPPPIMSTSVAAVTQRLNGGAANGSSPSKNSWRPNR